MMEANVLNFLAACAMAHDWGMEELSFISHADGTLEMEGNYSLKLHDAGWGGVIPPSRISRLRKRLGILRALGHLNPLSSMTTVATFSLRLGTNPKPLFLLF